MIRYLAEKGAILLASLLVVATLTFFIMHAIPGDPFTQDQAIPEEVLKALHRHYGLDKPLLWQYFLYLKSVCFFDFGPSLMYQGRTVNEIITAGFPISFFLGLEALFLSIIGGIAWGALAALYHLRWVDKLCLFVGILGISIPSFLLGSFLQYLFAIKLDFFPVARWGSFSHSILPALTLSALPFAFIARLTRANMVEVLQQNYILTAKSKGINAFQLIWRHAIPNTLIPILAYIGPLMGSIFTGSFVIEKIFGIPGLGQWLVNSITNRDYPLIMGLTIFYSAILMISVFFLDCICCMIDPRIQFFNNVLLREYSDGKL
jgi:oligopeptide transport system permease protein